MKLCGSDTHFGDKASAKYLRGLLPREAILAARSAMYQQMQADVALDDDSTFEYPTGAGAFYMGKKEVTHHPNFLAAVEHPHAYTFFDALFDEPSRSFDHKPEFRSYRAAGSATAEFRIIAHG